MNQHSEAHAAKLRHILISACSTCNPPMYEWCTSWGTCLKAFPATFNIETPPPPIPPYSASCNRTTTGANRVFVQVGFDYHHSTATTTYHYCHKYATTTYHQHYMQARRNGRRVETAEMAEMAKTLRSKIPFIITPTQIISPSDKSISALPGLHWYSCIANAQNWRWLAMWLSDWHCNEHA